MSDLYEFISIEYSFREIDFKGAPLLGVAQKHNLHRPVSRLLAVVVNSGPVDIKYSIMKLSIACSSTM
jgi:hypothetical protein